MRLIAFALSVAACGLWIGVRTLGVSVAKTDSRLAASLNGGNADILGAQSRRMLEASQMDIAVALARKALRRDPTVVSAVQSVGLAAQAAGDVGKAGRLLSYAQGLSRRNLQTHLWAIEYYVARGNTSRVLGEYDLALRTSLPARDILFPILGSAVADPVVALDLVARLKRRPLWYEAFLSFVAGDNRVAPATAVDFLRATRDAGVAVPSASLATLVTRSLDAQQFRTAWAAYALKRPGADPSRLRDPGFKALPEEPAPFDWALFNDGSVLAQAVEENGAGRLEIEAGSGSAGLAAQQVQMLPPGKYRLIVDADAISEGANLVWSLACRDGSEISRLMMPGGMARHHAETSFTVPPFSTIQTLKLVADAGESPQGLHAAITRVIVAPVGR